MLLRIKCVSQHKHLTLFGFKLNKYEYFKFENIAHFSAQNEIFKNISWLQISAEAKCRICLFYKWADSAFLFCMTVLPSKAIR